MCAQSCLTLATLWTVACQAPLSMGFPRQEYWSGLQFPFPGDLLDPGIEPTSPVPPVLQADSSTAEPSVKTLCNFIVKLIIIISYSLNEFSIYVHI